MPPLLLLAVLLLASSGSSISNKTPRHVGSSGGFSSFGGSGSSSFAQSSAYGGASAGTSSGSGGCGGCGGSGAPSGSFSSAGGGHGYFPGSEDLSKVAFWWNSPDSPFKNAQEYFKRCALKGDCANIPGPFNFVGYEGANQLPAVVGCAGAGCGGKAPGKEPIGPVDLSKNPFLNGEIKGIAVSSCSGSACPGGKPHVTVTNCEGGECKTVKHEGEPGKVDLSGNPFFSGGFSSFGTGFKTSHGAGSEIAQQHTPGGVKGGVKGSGSFGTGIHTGVFGGSGTFGTHGGTASFGTGTSGSGPSGSGPSGSGPSGTGSGTYYQHSSSFGGSGCSGSACVPNKEITPPPFGGSGSYQPGQSGCAGKAGCQPSGGSYQPGKPGSYQPGTPGSYQPGQTSGSGSYQPGQTGGSGSYQPGQASGSGSFQPGSSGCAGKTGCQPSGGSYQPGKPGSPGSYQPGTPGSHQPGSPGSHQPGSHQPGSPGSHQPGTPGYQPGTGHTPGKSPTTPGSYQPGTPSGSGYEPGKPGSASHGGYQPGQPSGSGYQPGKPGGYEPGKPGSYEPGKPGSYEPGKPGGYEPGKPGSYEPGKPGSYEPGQPGSYEPGKPGSYEPGKPGSYQPGQSGTGYQPGKTCYPGDVGCQKPQTTPNCYPGQPGCTQSGQGSQPGHSQQIPTCYPGQPGCSQPGQSQPGQSQTGQQIPTCYPGQAGCSQTGKPQTIPTCYPGQPGCSQPGQGSKPSCYPGQPGCSQTETGKPQCYPGQPGCSQTESGKPQCYPGQPGCDQGGSGKPQCYPGQPGCGQGETGKPQCYPGQPGCGQSESGKPQCYPGQPGCGQSESGKPQCYPGQPGCGQSESGKPQCYPGQPGCAQTQPGKPQCYPGQPGCGQSGSGKPQCYPGQPGCGQTETGKPQCYPGQPGCSQSQPGKPQCSPGQPGCAQPSPSCYPGQPGCSKPSTPSIYTSGTSGYDTSGAGFTSTPFEQKPNFPDGGKYPGQKPQTTDGELTLRCGGNGYFCVEKHLCSNGIINTNGEQIFQTRTGDQFCNVNSQVCCRLPSLGGSTYFHSTTNHASSSSGASSGSNTFYTSGYGGPTVASTIANQYTPGKNLPDSQHSATSQPGLIHIPPHGQLQPGKTIQIPGSQGNSPGVIHILPEGETGRPFTSGSGLIHIPPSSPKGQPGGGLPRPFTSGPNYVSVTSNGGVSKPGFGVTPGQESTFKDVKNELGFASTIQGPAYLPPASSPTPNTYTPDLEPPNIPGSPSENTPNILIPQRPSTPVVIYQPTQTTQKTYYTPPTTQKTYYTPPTTQKIYYTPPTTQKNYYTPPTTQKTYYTPSTTQRPYYTPSGTTPKSYYTPPNVITTPTKYNNGYLPPSEPTDSSIIKIDIIRPPVTPPTYPKYTPTTTEPNEIPQPAGTSETRLKPPGSQTKSTDFPLNTTPYPGCPAALKCVESQFCTADGVISTTAVFLTKEQESNRVPLTTCTDPESGIIGNCCRDPNYKDPWPASQLGLYNPNDGFDNGQYKTNKNDGKYKRPQPGVKGRPSGGRPFQDPNQIGASSNLPGTYARPNQGYPQPGQSSPGGNQGGYQQPGQSGSPPGNQGGYQQPGQIGSPSGNQGTYVRPNQGYPSEVPGIPFDHRQVNKPLLVDVKSPIEINLNGKQPYSSSKFSSETCGIRRPGGNPKGQSPIDVDFAEIPWQAMILRDSNRSLLCGGAIIRRDAVLTSASCLEGLPSSDILVKGGEWKLGIDEEPKPFQIIKVATVVRHPGYNPGNKFNDVALLILTEKFRLDKNVDTICLPGVDLDVQSAFQNAKCITTGWGKTILQLHLLNALMHSLDVGIVPPSQCQQTLQQYHSSSVPYYNTNCICGATKQPNTDICDVDIGSALACDTGDGRYTLAGIYNWDTGCKSQSQLAGYWKVDTYWIESTLQRPVNDLKIEENGYFQRLSHPGHKEQNCHCQNGKK